MVLCFSLVTNGLKIPPFHWIVLGTTILLWSYLLAISWHGTPLSKEWAGDTCSTESQIWFHGWPSSKWSEVSSTLLCLTQISPLCSFNDSVEWELLSLFFMCKNMWESLGSGKWLFMILLPGLSLFTMLPFPNCPAAWVYTSVVSKWIYK